ncbi:hypothetical protein A2U01_0091132, partial [Trifolium medium]|nr:hypothetical protein [Trifolium medium]
MKKLNVMMKTKQLNLEIVPTSLLHSIAFLYMQQDQHSTLEGLKIQ